MVKRAFWSRMYSNASRCLVGGYPASAPAMSKPTTPLSRNRIANSAISRDIAACRIAVTKQRTVIRRPAAAQACSPAGKPRQHAVDDLIEGQPLVDVQLRRESHLGIHHRVGGQVLHAFVGD